MTTMDTLELMEDADCMCIALEIERPSVCIADTSRLIIKHIHTSYISANSFMHSAAYNIAKDPLAHSGFNDIDQLQHPNQRLAQGFSRENITGIMPLYLFQSHWKIANSII